VPSWQAVGWALTSGITEEQAMALISSSRFIAETLRGYGITHVYFVPGILYEAISEFADLGGTPVLTHGEVPAAYMADGYARAARGPGIVMCQTVGSANVAAGLRDAYLAGSPVIAITGGPSPRYRYKNLYQQLEDLAMFEPVTKFNGRVEAADRLPDMLRQAFREATTGAPGPVHLELPGRNGYGILGEFDLELIIEEEFAHFPPFRLEAEVNRIRQALDLLVAAKRPVIIAGGGTVASDGGAELVALAAKLSVPVATSLSGKGSIPEDHPLALGVVGHYPRQSVNKTVAEADLVFYVGSKVGSMTTNDYKIPRPGTAVIQLDIDPTQIGRNYPVKVGMVGDVKATLSRMVELARPAEHAEWVGRAQGMLAEWRAEVAPMLNSDAVPIRPERLCKELQDFLPEDAVLVADTGHAAHWSGMMIDLKHSSQRFIRCGGTLGWAFPASIGVKCALPDRPVICFTGDGGIDYYSSETETAARARINTIVIVNNNAALSHPMRNAEAASRGKKSPGRLQWAFSKTNYAAMAELRGCLGIRVEKPGELRSALDRALEAKRPTVIDVVTELEAIAPAAWG